MCLLHWRTFFMMRGKQRWERLSADAGERVGAIHNGMSLSISCVMKKDWEGLHGPTAARDRAIAMHRLLPFRLSKWKPAACEVRLREKKKKKDKRSTRLNASRSCSLSPQWRGSFTTAAHLQRRKRASQMEICRLWGGLMGNIEGNKQKRKQYKRKSWSLNSHKLEQVGTTSDLTQSHSHHGSFW